MRVIFFGSGAFGLPTLASLQDACDVVAVVSQPDRPAGRRRTPTPTPVSAEAIRLGLDLERCQDVNDQATSTRLRAIGADAWVVIAFGQKLSPTLLAGRFALNLHGSLLPRWRGAAPIHHAVLAGDDHTGVSVITLADVMDAGHVLASQSRAIEPTDTTGDLHDALAQLGPELVLQVLDEHNRGVLSPSVQQTDAVTHAPKLGRADARVDLEASPDALRRRINAMSPWPGCCLLAGEGELRLLRSGPSSACIPSGHLSSDGDLGCAGGSVRLLEVQPAGGRRMNFTDWARGRRLENLLQVEGAP